MTTTAIHKRNIWDALVIEPLDLAVSQPHQLFISALSVYLVASEAAMLAPAPFNWLMAVGAEWAYLRGLSSGEATATVWSKRLIYAALALLVVYGSLWGFRQFGALPKDHAVAAGAWAIVGAITLTLVHIVTIGAVTFCSAMIHRDATEAERVSKETEAKTVAERLRKATEREDARKVAWQDANDAILIETQRQKAALALEQEAARQKMQLAADRAQLRAATKAQPARNRIIIDGVEYPSVQAAADAHGITRQAMSKRLKKEGI